MGREIPKRHFPGAGRASNPLLFHGRTHVEELHVTCVRAGRFESATFQCRPGLQSAPHPGRSDGGDGSPSPWHSAIARLLLWNAMETGFHRPMDTPPRHVAGRLFLTGKTGPPISSAWEPVSTALRDSKTLLLRDAVETGFHRPMDGHTSETRGWTSFFDWAGRASNQLLSSSSRAGRWRGNILRKITTPSPRPGPPISSLGCQESPDFTACDNVAGCEIGLSWLDWQSHLSCEVRARGCHC